MISIYFTLSLLTTTVADTAGVYLTAADFARHHLSYAVTDANLHIGAPVSNHLVQVTGNNGQVRRFPAGSLYGVRKDGQDYRLVLTDKAARFKLDAGFYKIAATIPLYIYSSRYVFSATRLYFSLTSTDSLHLLTPRSLTKYFPGKPALVQEINHDKKLRYSIATRDEDGQLRVAKIMAKYLP
jgi:uncharacterized protein YpmS